MLGQPVQGERHTDKETDRQVSQTHRQNGQMEKSGRYTDKERDKWTRRADIETRKETNKPATQTLKQGEL